VKAKRKQGRDRVFFAVLLLDSNIYLFFTMGGWTNSVKVCGGTYLSGGSIL
jgi:hypothetical protein